jgi:Sulfite exporter TauE/SafE.
MILILSKVNELKISHSNSIKVFVALIFSISAFLIFLFDDKVNWIYGINLGIGSALGGWAASRWSYNKSDLTMKIILSIIIMVMSINLWFF